MKAGERQKAQKIINRIERGDFDANDVDNLFMRMRAHCHGKKVFREIADFVAHNDRRTRGVTADSLEAFYLTFRFFVEYIAPKNPLDVWSPFPLYVKKLMKYQVLKCKEEDLRARFGASRKHLSSMIDSAFTEDKNNGTALLKKSGKASDSITRMAHFLLSFIGSYPAYSQDAVVSEVLDVINRNHFVVDRHKFLSQSDRLTVCVLFLLHETEFGIGVQSQGIVEYRATMNLSRTTRNSWMRTGIRLLIMKRSVSCELTGLLWLITKILK